LKVQILGNYWLEFTLDSKFKKTEL
jgi:hypothetical protein